MRDHYDRGPAREEREMFNAVCDECGRNCKVPFRPSSNKPVYCSDCFEKMQGVNKRRDGSYGDMNLQAQLDDINNKLYKILKMLEPKPEPVYNKLAPVKRKAERLMEEALKNAEENNSVDEAE